MLKMDVITVKRISTYYNMIDVYQLYKRCIVSEFFLILLLYGYLINIVNVLENGTEICMGSVQPSKVHYHVGRQRETIRQDE